MVAVDFFVMWLHEDDFMEAIQLEKLSEQQLVEARQAINKLIAEKHAEEKVALWFVCDEYLNYSCFLRKNYDKAVNSLIEEINRKATSFS